MTDPDDAAVQAGQFLQRSEQRPDPTDTRDLDQAVALAQAGLAAARGDFDLELDLHAILGDALVNRAKARMLMSMAGKAVSPDFIRADLDGGIAHIEALLAMVPATEPVRAQLLAQVTLACTWRTSFEDDDEWPSCTDRMVRYAREAWQLLDPDDPERPVAGIALAKGLYDQVRRPRAEYPARLVDLMIDVLSETAPRLDDGSVERLLAEVLLGAGLVMRGQESGNAADYAAARPIVLRAAEALPLGAPEHADTVRELARTLSALADYGLLSDHLDLAVSVLRSAVANPVGNPAQDAIILMGLAGVLRIRAFRSGSRELRDSPDAREAIELLRSAYDTAPAGSVARLIAAWDVGSALLTRYLQTEIREDLDAAQFYLDAAREAEAAGQAGALRGSVTEHDAIVAYTTGLLNLARGMYGDLAALDEAIRYFQTALGQWPDWHPFAARTRVELATARLLRASRAKPPDVAELRAAVRAMRAATGAVPAGEATSPVAVLQAAGAFAMTAQVSGDPVMIREAIAQLSRARDQLDPGYGERLRFTGMLGTVSASLYELTGSEADLRAAISWLEEAHAEFDREPGHPRHGDVLSALARLRHASGDARQAIEAGLALLRVRVRDVLLQTGTPRGLASARAAAADGLRFARWCLDAGLPDRAVEALELGRGLVLHAATSTAELPELLAARGRDDLAREWRAQAEGPWDSGTGAAGNASGLPDSLPGLLGPGADGLVVPGDLRERTLDALADVAADRLLAAPGQPEIGAALAPAGADALVYLLLAEDAQTVRALLVPAGRGQPREVPLPGLAVGTLLDECAAAQAELLTVASEETEVIARRRWAATFDPLCEWAWMAVVGPLLEVLPSRPPRLVLVPAGPLSLIPWHAAQCADGDGRVYACARAVFSYAASGRQFTEVSRRPQLPAGHSPVIVADPTSSLEGAAAEAQAIRDSFYPGARYLGPGTGPADGAAQPGEVLAALPSAIGAGASVLHVAGHANVETGNPDRSYLELADGQRLTAEAILRQAAGRSPGAAGGLICLAACRTDLAAEDYDEALTLATAFLAAGAVGVVGARWELPDRSSSVLMFMFHYFLINRSLPAAEALRQAQLWMLDPERSVPPDARMPGWLASATRSRSLARLTSWAGITHQGQ
jgi:tetratricopeptide (TPR) repeat protein